MSTKNIIPARTSLNANSAADINIIRELLIEIIGDTPSETSTGLETITVNGNVNIGGSLPIGTPFPHDSTLDGVPDLPSSCCYLNGQLISDVDSPLNGKRVRNLNGANVVLTLTWTADSGGAYATVSSADLNALNKGDNVSGTGIAANTIIDDITGNTVIITDASASGSIETTFTNDGMVIYGGAGGSQGDQMQGYALQAYYYNSASSVSGYYMVEPNSVMAGFNQAGKAALTTNTIRLDDGTNGTPRIGTRTRAHGRIMLMATRFK